MVYVWFIINSQVYYRGLVQSNLQVGLVWKFDLFQKQTNLSKRKKLSITESSKVAQFFTLYGKLFTMFRKFEF